jgi:hypothetical protein
MNIAVFITIWAVSVAMAVARAMGEKAQWFQAAAHLWVGGLVVAAFASSGRSRWTCAFAVIGLTIVEVYCFFVQPRIAASCPPPTKSAPNKHNLDDFI